MLDMGCHVRAIVQYYIMVFNIYFDKRVIKQLNISLNISLEDKFCLQCGFRKPTFARGYCKFSVKNSDLKMFSPKMCFLFSLFLLATLFDKTDVDCGLLKVVYCSTTRV